MSSLDDFEQKRSHAIPIAMIVFGLFAVFIGLLDPSGGNGQRPASLTPDQMQLMRADAVAGFRAPSQPDNPPR